MTVSLANGNPVQYVGNGTTVTFDYPWKISASTDLVVGFIVSGSYAQQSSGYTVADVGVNGGGSITFGTAPPVGTTVDLRPLVPETQPAEFGNLTAYLPDNTTNALDRLTLILQGLTRRTYTYGIHGPDTESTAWPTLPPPSGRLGTVLMFDSVYGLPTTGIPTGSVVNTALIESLLSGTWTFGASGGLTQTQPLSGTAYTFSGASGSPVIAVDSGNTGSASVADLPITRAGSTANHAQEGPCLVLTDSSASQSLCIQESGGQIEIWHQSGGVWTQVALMTSTGQWGFFEPSYGVNSTTYSATSSTGFFTATLTGMTSTTTGNVNWRRNGSLVTLYPAGNITGTSNTTALTMTGLPAAIQPAAEQLVPCWGVANAGNSVFCQADVQTSGTIVFGVPTAFGSAGMLANATGFTASASKGVFFTWSISYVLN